MRFVKIDINSKRILIKSFLLFVIIAFALTSYSQSDSISVEKFNIHDTIQWQNIFQKDGILFYLKLSSCNLTSNPENQQFFYFKLLNTLPLDLLVEWDILMWYNGSCVNCGSDIFLENQRKFIVNAGSFIEGSCTQQNLDLKVLYLFGDNPNLPKLSHFKLSNLLISPAPRTN